MEIINENSDLVGRGLVAIDSSLLKEYLRKKESGIDSTKTSEIIHRDELVILIDKHN